MVGISRLKKVGKIHYYTGVSEEMKARYAGGFVWQMPLTSNYPEEGFVIPYHKYRDNPEVLKRIVLVPENSRNFKYATREVSEDDSLALVEKLVEIASFLIEIKDDTQNWEERRKWLLKLFNELWKKRLTYPGLPEVLSHIGFEEAIDYYKRQVESGNDKFAYEEIKGLLNGEKATISGLNIGDPKLRAVKRNWQLLETEEKELLSNIMPRFALSVNQIKNVLDESRKQNNIYSSIKEINENPYILCEQYIGDDADDNISFHSIDHGVLPSPDLGLEGIFPKNAAERFRALCIDILKRETIHSFVSQTKVLFHINNKLSYLPDWRNHQFAAKYFEVDADFLEEAITIHKFDNKFYVYLNEVREDERLIKSVIKQLQERSEISLRVEISKKQFYEMLRYENEKSGLMEKAPEQYDEALQGQAISSP